MSAKKVGQAVQADWDNREFVESLRLNIHRIYTFVNDFEASAKGRLAALNSKLTSLERQLTYLESQVLSADRAGESVGRGEACGPGGIPWAGESSEIGGRVESGAGREGGRGDEVAGSVARRD
ncbi:unnamed protein product [Closterium sp. NIES-65]|nr:unnamed protein product [Closterium sp. NIES-65]